MKQVFMLIGLLLVSACDQGSEPVTNTETPLRSVKLYQVTNEALAQSRLFIGKTIASTKAVLSFPLSGKVVAIHVNKGDRVESGQQLAQLETTDLQQDKKSSLASLNQARAQYQNNKADFNRKKSLSDQGLITLNDLDESQTNLISAESQLKIAQSDLQDIENKLQDTILSSPYAGVVSSRSIDPFSEVSAGQEVIIIEADGQQHQVEFGVPAQMIGLLNLGQTVEITASKDRPILLGEITEISPTADVGSVFRVKATLLPDQDEIQSGLSVEVRAELHRPKDKQGVLIPVSAVLSSLDNSLYVYVFDETTETLRKTTVKAANDVVGNKVAVTGIQAGDKIVSAGVAFVSDGLKVKPYQATDGTDG